MVGTGSNGLGGRHRSGAAPQARAYGEPVAVSWRFSRSVRRISARRAVAETCLRPAACAGKLASAPTGREISGIGNRCGCGRRSAVLGSAASRGAKVVEDAADDAALGNECDCRGAMGIAGVLWRVETRVAPSVSFSAGPLA